MDVLLETHRVAVGFYAANRMALGGSSFGPLSFGSGPTSPGAPGHVLMDTFDQFWKMTEQTIKGSREQAFIHELQLRFDLGYLLRRWRLQQ